MEEEDDDDDDDDDDDESCGSHFVTKRSRLFASMILPVRTRCIIWLLNFYSAVNFIKITNFEYVKRRHYFVVLFHT